MEKEKNGAAAASTAVWIAIGTAMGVAISTAHATHEALLPTLGCWSALAVSTTLAATAGAVCAAVALREFGAAQPRNGTR